MASSKRFSIDTNIDINIDRSAALIVQHSNIFVEDPDPISLAYWHAQQEVRTHESSYF